jgi:hypothetical protein
MKLDEERGTSHLDELTDRGQMPGGGELAETIAIPHSPSPHRSYRAGGGRSGADLDLEEHGQNCNDPEPNIASQVVRVLRDPSLCVCVGGLMIKEYNPVQPKEYGRHNHPECDHDVANPTARKRSALKGQTDGQRCDAKRSSDQRATGNILFSCHLPLLAWACIEGFKLIAARRVQQERAPRR